MAKHQAVIKRWFNKRAMIKSFSISNLVLLWDKAKQKLGSHTKFQCLWTGPYQIAEILGENTFRLSSLQGKFLPFPVNGQFLKYYFEAEKKLKKLLDFISTFSLDFYSCKCVYFLQVCFSFILCVFFQSMLLFKVMLVQRVKV